MTNKAQIKCINKNDRFNIYERITHVGGFTDRKWTLTTDDAIGKIKRGEWRFYVGQGLLTEVNVVVAISPYGNEYLKTESDREETNNLLYLPECQ